MNKKIIWIIVIVLILFAGLIAVTQEAPPQEVLPSERVNQTTPEEEIEYENDFTYFYEYTTGIPDWVRPVRWFRSNKGGMALEEMPSRVTAMRNEYVLAVNFVQMDAIPEYLLPYYDVGYFIEVRTLYQRGQQIRTQWIFRDINGIARLASVFLETSEPARNEDPANDTSDNLETKHNAGFIEIFDENSLFITEYRYYDDGRRNRTDHVYRDGLLVSSTVLFWDEDTGEFREAYADFLRYNRSLFLRSVERIFYEDRQLSFAEEPVRFSFPRRIAEMSDPRNLIGEKINAYPEFFGEVTISRNDRIVFITDVRGNVLTQTLYDEEDNAVWVIQNTWLNDRIISTLKREGDTVYLAEYEYNSNGDRIVERNFKNGVLERLVTTHGRRDIEELFFNDVVVLVAVWEDGRKISETRVNNR